MLSGENLFPSSGPATAAGSPANVVPRAAVTAMTNRVLRLRRPAARERRSCGVITHKPSVIINGFRFQQWCQNTLAESGLQQGLRFPVCHTGIVEK